jgi:hypothetical protein
MGIGRFVTHTMFGRGASDYGAVQVPGSQQFELPAGKVFLTYQESKKSKVSGKDDSALVDVRFSAPVDLQVAVTPAGGGPPLSIEGPGLMGAGTHTSTRKDQSRDEIGSVEIVTPGTYTVTAGPELSGAVDPQVLLGS